MFVSRAEMFARYIIENGSTIRQTAQHYNYSKSTVHNDVSNRLKMYNTALFVEVQKVLLINFKEKHIRGGIATRNKYENR